MFSNSDWVIIVDKTANEINTTIQLFNIFRELRTIYMVEYYNRWSSLNYAISVLENRFRLHDTTRNGANIQPETVDLAYNNAEEAIKGFNNITSLQHWLIKHIRLLHKAIDQTADMIPIMLKYYNELKERANNKHTWYNVIPSIHLYDCLQHIPITYESDYSDDRYY